MTEPERIDPRLRLTLAALADVVPADPTDHPHLLGESPEDVAQRAAQRTAFRRRHWDTNTPARFAPDVARLAGLRPGQNPDDLTRWWDQGVRTLLLWSTTTGNGKSHAAYAVGHNAVDRGEVRAACWHAIKFNEAMRPGRDETAYDVACTVDLLLLDDLGRERLTDWTVERLQGVLDERWSNHLRTIITTNLDGASFLARYGDPIVDRLRDDCWRVEVTGPSMRAPAAW